MLWLFSLVVVLFHLSVASMGVFNALAIKVLLPLLLVFFLDSKMKGVSAKPQSCGHERALRNSQQQEHKEERQDRSTNPYRVHSLGWSGHRDHHRVWSQCRQFLYHALTGLLEHGCRLMARHWRTYPRKCSMFSHWSHEQVPSLRWE